MRCLLLQITGFCLIPLLGPGLVAAEKPGASPKHVLGKKAESTCGSHGTTVDFVDTPREAAKLAKKEQKLVFVLHVSGNFEDPRFT